MPLKVSNPRIIPSVVNSQVLIPGDLLEHTVALKGVPPYARMVNLKAMRTGGAGDIYAYHGDSLVYVTYTSAHTQCYMVLLNEKGELRYKASNATAEFTLAICGVLLTV